MHRVWIHNESSGKVETIYRKNYQSIHEAKQGISNYMTFYDQERPH